MTAYDDDLMTRVIALSAAARANGDADISREFFVASSYLSTVTVLYKRGGFTEGDVEALPYGDAVFDAVISQFGHMFAPRPEVATSEMLRVLKPGRICAIHVKVSDWPVVPSNDFVLPSRVVTLIPPRTKLTPSPSVR